ncbi:hypothetical protein HanXRQr2_Chr10g0425761 [Helianthus annuus]|uniref:Uncharacterized protein n=1 Tax=Helianthus annuus TaxID=4232 RepID=A0A9K3HUZ1_HELAN|nr:hypothetical protein HanXRQr2_Chr10g0425761 [Helianthus annuus]KAJ0520445.1 hypothetical protein HanIR_Chr10g0459441 [Helianthus annuus]KAJ0528905.1 hypothetical protein HanHA89_Chr10g0371651 [Helianthus annuus]KAJ0695820.1 hypothetical protein HanLR1_Chr10g0349871 [Helianthus annuus]
MLVVMEDVQFLQFEPKLVRYCMHCQAHVKGFDHRGSWKLYRLWRHCPKK